MTTNVVEGNLSLRLWGHLQKVCELDVRVSGVISGSSYIQPFVKHFIIFGRIFNSPSPCCCCCWSKVLNPIGKSWGRDRCTLSSFSIFNQMIVVHLFFFFVFATMSKKQ